ncbi:hypothetical protein BDK88_1165 [Natrinema hispanicum]|uniref:Uncharacterized protein n=1 Tax=Natrinema hispanicum TaxID=392421 RepID=A0A482YF19_9EURY|nr:hypothetical protein [Natrinema hispanicum]RZV12268.1 hypothetical protein BDK88_1165 [Natrinema hispanicum]
MEKADSCRRAAVEAVADVEPPRLYEYIESVLDRASMVPAALTFESAVAMAPEGHALEDVKGRCHDIEPDSGDHHQSHASDRDRDPESIVTHAAGVQLIYEGLRLTRSLAHDEPWTATDADASDADLAILAADILVARGFYLLAHTDAAGKAVRTVQSFGRDQTCRSALEAETEADVGTDSTDLESIDTNLERDVLELAVRTGAVAVDETPSPKLLAVAADIADTAGTSFPPVTECLTDLEAKVREQSLEDSTTDRATSATDH